MPRILVGLGLLAILLTGCSRDEVDQEEPDQVQDRVLWETPPIPWPVRVFVDGEEVPAQVIRGWLEPEWQHFFQARHDTATPAEVQSAEAEFLADPSRRFEGLVRAVLMLQEAERRRPEILEAELARILADFRRHGGGVYDSLARELGEDGVRAHLERIWRLRKLEEDFDAEVPAPAEAAIAEEYQRVVEEYLADNPGHRPPTFEELRERLAAKLAVEERNRRIEAMIDERRARVRVELELPDGRRIPLPPPARH